MSSTNFYRYQSMNRGKSRSKTRSTKINQKQIFGSKKSRNNLTLDGMNLSSISDARVPESNSMLIKMIHKNKKMKGFHSKFHSETPKRKRKNLDCDFPQQKFTKGEKSIDKKTTATKERSIANVLKENIEKSLNSKIKSLEKDLKKKRIEFTIRNQQYSENLSKLGEKSQHEKLKIYLYEMLNNPRYEFDLEETENIR